MLQKFDPRNADLKVYVNGEIVHRDEAKVSVFDSVVQGGDAVWEGLRLYKQGIFLFDRHLSRLFDSAHAMGFQNVPSKEYIIDAVKQTVEANNMVDGVHMRLTLTRGEKITSGMDPRLNDKGLGLIVLAEYKAPVYDNSKGIDIITSAIRRNSPSFLDSKIHHTNLINNILAKMQANVANVDAALMLDNYGFLAELNGTNIFTVRGNEIFTPFADACLHGITRGMILQLAKENNIAIREKNISLTELYTADQVFTTGTMGELTPVFEVDGRKIVNKSGTDVFEKMGSIFKASIPNYCIPII